MIVCQESPFEPSKPQPTSALTLQRIEDHASDSHESKHKDYLEEKAVSDYGMYVMPLFSVIMKIWPIHFILSLSAQFWFYIE